MTALTKKDRRYEWGDAQQEAFEKIKALIASALVFARPAFDAQFVVQTDASDTGIGAVLLQVIDGQERVLQLSVSFVRADAHTQTHARNSVAHRRTSIAAHDRRARPRRWT